MSVIRLSLKDVYSAVMADDSHILVVKRELTVNDCEYYDKVGWKYFREENLVDRYLPEINPSRYFNSGYFLHEGSGGIVVDIFGKNYLVNFCEDVWYRPWEASGKELILTLTDREVTKSDSDQSDCRFNYYYKFFGQLVWVQNSYFPLDLLGRSCYHFLTIENGWGDSGNYNILLGFDENRIPNVGYFEASCC